MALFDNFPYTNFHNLNLDWIIKVLKNAVSELEEIQTNWESVRDSANNAVEQATTAQNVANDAKKAANSATTTATEAKNLATEAKELATDASNTAEGADANSRSAYNIATAARQTATDANATAEQAEETANGFSSRIATAEKNASDALTGATEANQNAKTAVSMANTLQQSVDSIGDIAQQAHDLATTNESDIASLDADVAQLNTAIVTRPTKYIGNSIHSSQVFNNLQVNDNLLVVISEDYTEENYDTEMYEYMAWASSLADYDVNITFSVTWHDSNNNNYTEPALLTPLNAVFTIDKNSPYICDWTFIFVRSANFQYFKCDNTKGVEITPTVSLRYRGVKKNS